MKRKARERRVCKCGHPRYGFTGHCSCHKEHYCLSCEEDNRVCRYKPRAKPRRAKRGER